MLFLLLLTMLLLVGIYLFHEVARTRQIFRWEGRVITKGEVRFMLIESTPMFFDKSDSRWFGYQQDVAERRLVEQELKVKTRMLETLSLQDGLTQSANRRYFDERANQEWEKAEAAYGCERASLVGIIFNRSTSLAAGTQLFYFRHRLAN